jgi:hypothetical protein
MLFPGKGTHTSSPIVFLSEGTKKKKKNKKEGYEKNKRNDKTNNTKTK